MPDKRLIKDLIDIPERVYKGDFVLRLTEGVDRADETLDSYVVTPELVRNFDDALGFIKGAIDAQSSKATYLDGSFGSGKSHFMAVLHLLLQGHPKARAIPELAATVAKHNSWMQSRRFLLVPYHMIGARSLESAILGRYVEYVGSLHPDAPIPGVYVAEKLFHDAQRLRQTMGDTAFFAQLNSAAGAGEDWGDLERTWDAVRFDAAVTAAPESEERTRLVGDLVHTLFTAYAAAMQGQGEAYVPLDDGLSILSRHAKQIGYDCMVLFLDELILWLASHAADVSFVNREIQKVAKLVEAQHAERPIPIVSFVARQRDLRELVGEHIPGSQQLAFADTLKWWEGRLHKIGLLDRNLPAIAERRVLRPKSEQARHEIDAAFDRLKGMRSDVMDTLLTSEATRDMFRQVYPFSPALVATLVAVSSLLQRERTALKVMLQILADQRQSLQLGDIVPVGDLFDVIAEGDEAFSDVMRQHFENAKRLYHQKLLPLLEAEHKVRAGEVQALPFNDPKAIAFRVDDRLVKTLLLSALAPEVEPLRNLTAQRLAALNHGSIRSPIPGREGQMVLAKVRRWAAEVGEIKIGEEGANPTITVQLSGVDTESIIEKAKVADNPGERLRKMREIVFRELGIENDDQLFLVHPFSWRNTQRECDVLYANVRSLPDESLRSKEERWKVVIDFPFDEGSFTPRDDLARLQQFQQTAKTICWIPSFFSRAAQKDLGTLVILDHLLAGERFNDYASHLNATDRATARALVDNRRSQLRERLRACVEAAYGIADPAPGSIDESHELEEHLQSLDPTFKPKPPVGGNLRAALENLLDQAMSHQYPAHPHFSVEVKSSVLKKVYAEVQHALQEPQRRVYIDRPLRPLMHGIAVPLGLGEMGETHFVLGDFWQRHFLRKRAQDGGPVTVEKLRAWIDDPNPRGLQPWVQNLLILTFADQENYSFLLHGGPAGSVSLDSLHNDLTLEPVVLPARADWEEAARRLGPILGIEVPALCNATNAAKLAEDVRVQLAGARADCDRLCRALRQRMRELGMVPEQSSRMRTATAVQALVEAAVNAPVESVVAVLAKATLQTSATAMGSSLRKAKDICSGLEAINWEIFEGLDRLDDERAGEAQAIRTRVIEALGADEYAMALMPILQKAQSEGLRLITRERASPVLQPPPAPPPRIRLQANELGADLQGARRLFAEIEAGLRNDPRNRVDLSWKIERAAPAVASSRSQMASGSQESLQDDEHVAGSATSAVASDKLQVESRTEKGEK